MFKISVVRCSKGSLVGFYLFRVRSLETVFRNSVFTIPEFWSKYRIIQNTEYDVISCASNTF
jgi:hypothetical protein